MLTEKSEYLKVNKNTQPGDREIETVEIYVPLFWMGIPETLLKFVTLLQKIIRVRDLSTVPQKFGMKKNLVSGEALQVFEHKDQYRVT